MSKWVTFDPDKANELMDKMDEAKAANSETFLFEGTELTVEYARDLMYFIGDKMGGKPDDATIDIDIEYRGNEGREVSDEEYEEQTGGSASAASSKVN